MKIEQVDNIKVENIAGDFGTKKAKMADSTMFFDILSKFFYSNPIGSIVREITSNCFDSHVEAKVDEPVIVSLNEDEEGKFICFKDVGVGLSPDRIDKIYMNYGASTKRETDDQLGGWGLGSKTPLSYQDYFYIVTIFDGIKYNYVYSKGKVEPELDLLNEEETQERNGTEIKIYIKNENDIGKFRQELQSQLCYFENVYFKDWDIQNVYKIYEFKYSKYRSNLQYSEECHCILGSVSYPIDWKEIGLERFPVPIGVKFNIGELQVTPNRENLRYTDEVKAILFERVKLACKEIIEKFEAQNVPVTNYFEWLKIKASKPFITLDDGTGIIDKLYLYNVKEVDKKHKFPLFDEFPEFKKENFLDDLYQCVAIFSNGKEPKGRRYNPNYHRITDNISDNTNHRNSTYIIDKDVRVTEDKLFTFKNGDIFRPIKFATKKSFIKYKDYVEKSDDYEEYSEKLKKEAYFDLGRAKRLYHVIKTIREQVKEYFKPFRDLTDEEIKAYKEYKLANNAALQRKLNGKVLVHSISESRKYEWKVSEINWFKGLVVYGNREEVGKIEQANLFLSMFRTLRRVKEDRDNDKAKFKYSYNNKTLNPQAARVIMISMNNEQYFENRTNMIDVNNLYSDHPLFRKLASCYKIEDLFKNLLKYQSIGNIEFIEEISKINQRVGDLLNLLIRYRKENYRNTENSRENQDRQTLKKSILEVANTHNLFDPIIEDVLQEVNKWFEGVEILKYTELNEDSLPFVLKYLREKGKKLNWDYYYKYIKHEGQGEIPEGQVIIMFPEEEQEEKTKFEVLTKIA